MVKSRAPSSYVLYCTDWRLHSHSLIDCSSFTIWCIIAAMKQDLNLLLIAWRIVKTFRSQIFCIHFDSKVIKSIDAQFSPGEFHGYVRTTHYMIVFTTYAVFEMYIVPNSTMYTWNQLKQLYKTSSKCQLGTIRILEMVWSRAPKVPLFFLNHFSPCKFSGGQPFGKICKK